MRLHDMPVMPGPAARKWFGAWLKKMRTARGYGPQRQGDFAERLRLNQSAYSHVETGRQRPSVRLLLRLEFQMGFAHDELLQRAAPALTDETRLEWEEDCRFLRDLLSDVLDNVHERARTQLGLEEEPAS